MNKFLALPFVKGFFKKILAKRKGAVRNANVRTLAHEKNSKTVLVSEVLPGDMIIMISKNHLEKEFDHILLVKAVEYKNKIPTKIHYVHSIQWPTDGKYNHGFREGIIKITNIEKSITNQNWIENNQTGDENYTHSRAQKSNTQIQRIVE